MTALLDAQGISVHAGSKALVTEVDVTVEAGQIVALVGPNGAGKTTLLKALLGLIAHQGSTRVNGQLLSSLTPEQRAQQVAYVPQMSLLTARVTGRDVVAQGRFAHRGQGSDDKHAIAQALAETDCEELADRPFSVCSGGERARLLLARALATGAPLLLLDEPTASLDIAHALQLFQLLRRLADAGKGMVVVQHQLSDALRWSDQAVVLNQGRRVAAGPTSEVLTPSLIKEVFGLHMRHDGVAFDLIGAKNAT